MPSPAAAHETHVGMWLLPGHHQVVYELRRYLLHPGRNGVKRVMTAFQEGWGHLGTLMQLTMMRACWSTGIWGYARSCMAVLSDSPLLHTGTP